MPRVGEDGEVVGQSDGSLCEGEPVEYLSATYGRWIPATVEELNADGSVSLDVKPRADASRVRRRAWRVGERVEYSRGGSEVQWVSATVGRVHSDGSVSLEFSDDDDATVDEEQPAASATAAVTNPLSVDDPRPPPSLDLDLEETSPLMGCVGCVGANTPPTATPHTPQLGQQQAARARAQLQLGCSTSSGRSGHAAVWVQGHPQELWNGVYSRESVHEGWPVYCCAKNAADPKYLYRYEGDGADQLGQPHEPWRISSRHRPDDEPEM